MLRQQVQSGLPSGISLFGGDLKSGFGGKSNSSRSWGRSRYSSSACLSQSSVLGLISTLRWTTVPMRIRAAGAALALGGGDAGLGALDLAFEGFFPETLGFQEFFFSLLEFLVQGLLAFQQLVKFLLWIHRFR